jgi:hypothetical protein
MLLITCSKRFYNELVAMLYVRVFAHVEDEFLHLVSQILLKLR